MAALNQWIAGDAELPDQPDLDPDDPDDLSGPPAATVEPLDLVRFRPNVVVDGDEPFAEASWQGVRMGGIDYRTTMICDRCVMTTYDPQTLAGGKEPIRTLARHWRWNRKTWFGARLVPLSTGTISVGALVEPVMSRWRTAGNHRQAAFAPAEHRAYQPPIPTATTAIPTKSAR